MNVSWIQPEMGKNAIRQATHLEVATKYSKHKKLILNASVSAALRQPLNPNYLPEPPTMQFRYFNLKTRLQST